MRFMADYCHSIGINRTLGKMWSTSYVPDTLNVRVFEDPNRYDSADSDALSSNSSISDHDQDDKQSKRSVLKTKPIADDLVYTQDRAKQEAINYYAAFQ
jgi:hypothetical protein